MMEAIDLREGKQAAFLDDVARYYPDLDLPVKQMRDYRYWYENDWYSYGDATTLYTMMRALKPKRILEIGSGMSTALMLDVNDKYLSHEIRHTVISPLAHELDDILHEGDAERLTIIPRPVESADWKAHLDLEADDILFVDGSHRADKRDVQIVFFEILPSVKPGVAVHFHDIFWPFVYDKRFPAVWTETHLLRAFLSYNTEFEIMFWSSYMYGENAAWIEEHAPLIAQNPGAQMWIRRKE